MAHKHDNVEQLTQLHLFGASTLLVGWQKGHQSC